MQEFCSPSPSATLVFMFLSKLEALLQPGKLEKQISKSQGFKNILLFSEC